MNSFEISVDDEVFLISERIHPGGEVSYDFTWLNGPASGTYGFTVGRAVATSDDVQEPATLMTRDELAQEVRGFIEGFYEPGGLAEDFPDHVSARTRRLEGR